MKTLVRTIVACATFSVFGLSTVRAEDEAADTESAGEVEVAEGEESEGESSEGMPATRKTEKLYHILPYCRTLEGSAEVLCPGSTTWEPIQEGKFYALGSAYRTLNNETHLIIKFGKEIDVEIKGLASFGTRAQPLGDQTRTITLGSGTITVKSPRNLPDGVFIVTAPGFRTTDLKGNSRYTYTKSEDGDGDMVVVRCVTGELSLEGRHFKVVSMKVANEIKIRTSLDQLFTGLYGSRGDYTVRLDQGRHQIKDHGERDEEGNVLTREEEKYLDWTLSPQTSVRIHRAMPALGEKMAVTVLTFDATGLLKNSCTFVENSILVNSGEQGPVLKKDRESLVKKAAEATETVTVDAAAETTTVEAEATQDEDAPSSDTTSPTNAEEDFDF